MRIGELSRRTEASTRSLRYYEQLGLISSARQSNGYRDYDDSTVDIVMVIKSMLGLGYPTSLIGQVLSCESGGLPTDCDAVRLRVSEIRDDMDEKARQLLARRDALTSSLELTTSPLG